MMIIAPNSLARQKEGAQGEEGAGEMEDRQELRHQVRTLSQVQFGQVCRIRGTGENMDGGVGFHSTGEAERGSILSSHDRNGGRYRKMNEVVKG